MYVDETVQACVYESPMAARTVGRGGAGTGVGEGLAVAQGVKVGAVVGLAAISVGRSVGCGDDVAVGWAGEELQAATVSATSKPVTERVTSRCIRSS